MFHWDSPLMTVMRGIYDYIFVTVFMIVCSLPLVTAGAALCAGYDTVRRYLIEERGSNVMAVYFQSFKKNFKQSTVVWLICAAVCVLFWQGLRVMDALAYEGTPALVLQGVLIAGMVLTAAVLLCTLAVVARFENKVFGTLKNGVMLCFVNLWRFALLILVIAAAAAAIYVLPIVVLIAPALATFYWYRCMENVFKPYLPKSGDPEEEDEPEEDIEQ